MDQAAANTMGNSVSTDVQYWLQKRPLSGNMPQSHRPGAAILKPDEAAVPFKFSITLVNPHVCSGRPYESSRLTTETNQSILELASQNKTAAEIVRSPASQCFTRNILTIK